MTDLPPLPVTVISGYLGAGKTTLVNHLLRHAGGRRILVLVNDFGALAIDADLIESATGDTLTLANGCICCTMGGELMFALADALDRRPRPDVLVIEASGVAEPSRIAAVALAEREMRFGGVVTLADAANLPALLDDPRIGAQVAAQVTAADLILLTKADIGDAAATRARLAGLSAAPVLEAPFGRAPVELILDRPEALGPVAAGHGHDHGHAHGHAHGHGHDHAQDHGAVYGSWSHEGPAAPSRAAVEAFAHAAPGVWRLKGRFRLAEGGGLEVHRVGTVVQVAPIPAPPATRFAAIGLADRFDAAALAARWAACAGAA